MKGIFKDFLQMVRSDTETLPVPYCLAFFLPYCFSFSILLFLLDIQMILRFLKEFLVFEQHGDPPSSILPCFSSSIFLRDGLAKSIYIGISLSCSLKIRCDVYLTRSIAHGYVAYFFIFLLLPMKRRCCPQRFC